MDPLPIPSNQTRHSVRNRFSKRGYKVCMHILGETWSRHNAQASPLTLKAPARSVDDDTADAARNDTGDWQGDDPAHVDPRDHAPVDRPPGTGAKTNTNGGTGDTLGSRDRELCRVG